LCCAVVVDNDWSYSRFNRLVIMKLTPVETKTKSGDLADVVFDVALIVDRDNELQVIDSAKDNWRDFVDDKTILIKQIQLRP